MEVLKAAGSKWNFLPFKPGIVGGHCIGVDPYYLTNKAEEVGYNPEVILAGRRINDNMAKIFATRFVQIMVQNKINLQKSKVGILGITFKENCPDVRNSKVIDLIHELEKWNLNVLVSDDWADISEVKDKFNIDLQKIDKNNKVDALIVAVGHNEFRKIKPADLKAFYINEDKLVLGDLKSLYNKNECEKIGFNVFKL